MIHLDTNCLIGMVTNKSPLRLALLGRLSLGEKFAASAVAWSEFLNGPVKDEQIRDASGILETRIIPFGAVEAEMAAKLFNGTGRRRGSQPDCFIAATAICAGKPLITDNRKDFSRFTPFGLSLT